MSSPSAEKGKCIIFSAPSGAGKTTIVHHLLQCEFGLEFSVSACSRAMRPNEVEGVDYYFMTPDEFRKKIEADEFVEWEEVYKDNFYGTLKSEVRRIWALGKHVIFDVDVIGGLNLKYKFGDDALAIFVSVPDLSILEKRLRSRHTETEESIKRRMGKAVIEVEYAKDFDVIIMNEDREKAFRRAEEVVSQFLKIQR